MRFLGFDDEWEERYISEIISSKSKKYNPENSDSNYPSIELESLSQDSGELLSTFDSKNQKSIKNVFNTGDVLFGKLRPYLKKYYLADFNGVCSSEIWVLKSSILDSNYLYAFVQSNSFISLTEISSGSKMPRADWNLVSSSSIAYPSDLDERKKIGEIIKLINSRIQTQKKIIEGLIAQKNFIIKKLFKQNLSDLNTICLSDFLTIPDKIKPNIIDKEKLLTVKLHLKGVHKNENSDSLSLGATNYFIRKKGQFIYGKQNLFNGAFAIIPDKYDGFLSSADVPALDINEDIVNAKYLFYFFSRESFYKKLEDIASGSGSKRIHENTLLNQKITIPSLAIQNKVAIFLSKLDEKINLENELLAQYENQKKYLLQNLFV